MNLCKYSAYSRIRLFTATISSGTMQRKYIKKSFNIYYDINLSAYKCFESDITFTKLFFSTLNSDSANIVLPCRKGFLKGVFHLLSNQ